MEKVEQVAQVDQSNQKKLGFMAKIKALPVYLKLAASYQKMDKKQQKMVRTLVPVLVFAIFSLFLTSVIKNIKPPAVEPPKITPSPSPRPEIIFHENIVPSRYATDSAIIDFEERIKDVDTRLNEFDLRLPILVPPNLEFEVDFK